jgi:hypothetical protein
MFATPPILLMLGLLAQAETLPAEALPPSAPAPEVLPSPVAPAATEPEPASPEPESPVKVGFRAGAEFRMSADITPKVGYAFSPFFQYQVLQLAQRLGLAARAEFTFSRFAKLVADDERQLSVFDFAGLAVATLRLGPILPWLGAGFGLTVADISSDQSAYGPGDWSRTRLSVLGAFGFDVKVKGGLQIGLHAEYRGLINQPKLVLDSGERLTPIGDRLGVQAAVLYQF